MEEERVKEETLIFSIYIEDSYQAMSGPIGPRPLIFRDGFHSVLISENRFMEVNTLRR